MKLLVFAVTGPGLNRVRSLRFPRSSSCCRGGRRRALMDLQVLAFAVGWILATLGGAGSGPLLFCSSGPWWILCMNGEGRGRFIYLAELFDYSAGCGAMRLLPPTGRGGEGRRRSCSSSLTSMDWSLLHIRAPHVVVFLTAAIHGHQDGPSSTSIVEAFSILSQCSAARRCQVVRPRWRQVCWRLRLLAGKGSPSVLSPDDLGVAVWRSPVRCGGGTRGLVCILFLSSRVFFVRVRGLSSNFRSSRASDVKGLCEICTCHLGL